jgi:hypothetical protein
MGESGMSTSWSVLSGLIAKGHLDGLSGTDIAALGVLAAELDRIAASGGEMRAAFVAFCLHDALSPQELDELELSAFSGKCFWPKSFPSPKLWQAIFDDGHGLDDRDRAIGGALHVAEIARRALTHVHHHAPAASGAVSSNPELNAVELQPYKEQLLAIHEHRKHHHTKSRSQHAISVSIDIAGSTAIKAEMRTLAASISDPELTAQLYRAFYREFALAEQKFYGHLTDALTNDPKPVRLEHCYVVKGIGDEQWLLIQPESNDPLDLQSACLRVMEAALETIALPLRYTARPAASATASGSSEDGRRGADQWAFNVSTPLKVYMDVIGQDAIDISNERLELFESWLGHDRALHRKPHHLHHLLSRLNVGTSMPAIRARRTALRSDFIGHEIDRLFRAAKYAIPGLVSLGDIMFGLLNATTEESIAAFAERVRVPIPMDSNGGVERHLRMGHIRHEIKPGQMKGIDAAYAVHHLFTAGSLHSLCENLRTSRRANRWAPKSLREVAKLLGRPTVERIDQLLPD